MQHAVEDDSDNRKEERRARHQVHILLVVPRPRRPTLAVAQDGVLYDVSCGVVGAPALILGRDGKEHISVFACVNSTNEKFCVFASPKKIRWKKKEHSMKCISGEVPGSFLGAKEKGALAQLFCFWLVHCMRLIRLLRTGRTGPSTALRARLGL